MSKNLDDNHEEIFSRVLRAGRRTYFFDVRETKASDYYLTITESKKFTNEDDSFYYKKHKIYIYKEDFENFSSSSSFGSTKTATYLDFFFSIFVNSFAFSNSINL